MDKEIAVFSKKSILSTGDNAPWLSLTDYRTLTSLAACVLPSDGNGPGASEAGIVEAINRSCRKDPAGQALYKRGVRALAACAKRISGKPFSEMALEQQVAFLELIDRAEQRMYRPGASMSEKVLRKLSWWYYGRWLGLQPLIPFWKRVQKDVFQRFYTSAIAWEWLGYSGPLDTVTREPISNPDIRN